MLLWTALSLMTGAAILAVLWPLRRRDAEAGSAVEADIAVYRDQLAEIERDRASGLIGEAEGDAARAELGRRILRVAGEAEMLRPARSDLHRRAVAVIALVVLPLTAGATYLALGSPELDGQPLAARLEAAPQQSDVAILIRKVETHLEANPQDGRGYEVVAPIYMRLGRVDDAARAWSNAIRYLGPSPQRQTGLGEALLSQSGGVVTAEAKAAFQQALAQDPDDPKASYYLGLAAEQDGKPQEAAAIWSKLAAQSPADAPWQPLLRTALARVGATPPPAAPSAPGPNAADVAAAQSMTPEERNQMVRGMVEGLQQRLSQDGDDIDGWLRLMRAWSVLGETAKAKAAASDARAQFAKDDGALSRIDALSSELGLGS
ncbi:c-type cytochrome biogenesis protein CcmI [Ancylobacter sp. G4_0304]|uniref:c-type cytochrome biogenesis protein CcmI n=1 Tax=Ancylobacter sp. G4_0304 TaxID=3114289 RepID=UPI0039C65ED0